MIDMILDTEEPAEMDKEVMDNKKEECPTKLLECFESTILRSEVRLACLTACLTSVVRLFIAPIVCAFPTQYSKWVAWNNCSWPQWRFLISFILLISALQHSLAELPYPSSLLVCLFVPAMLTSSPSPPPPSSSPLLLWTPPSPPSTSWPLQSHQPRHTRHRFLLEMVYQSAKIGQIRFWTPMVPLIALACLPG